jgi:hypothetical protein
MRCPASKAVVVVSQVAQERLQGWLQWADDETADDEKSGSSKSFLLASHISITYQACSSL